MKHLAVALLAVLALSACAVTGQPARPGTAATLDDHTVTTDEVAAWGTAINGMSYSYDPGAVLTLLLLKPTIDAEAARLNISMTDEAKDFEARLWMASNLTEITDRTADMKEVAFTVKVLKFLLSNEDSAPVIADALTAIQNDASINPMYGDFSAQRFVESWGEQVQAESDQSGKLGEASYLLYKDLSGFNVLGQQEWMGEESAAPAPVPAS